MSSTDGYASDLSFHLNGKPVSMKDVDPSMTLLDYLRSPEVGLTGAKLACGEGSCGACTVVVARFEPLLGKTVERAVNACLRPLCSLDGAAITTIEGLGTSRTPNPIQSRLETWSDGQTNWNGSQCGFCSPGFAMSMYGLLRTNAAPSEQYVEDHFDGNLCRCTGYLPILKSMRSFAREPNAVADALKPFAPATVSSWVRKQPRALHLRANGQDWYQPIDLTSLLALRSAAGNREVRLVSGNTGMAVDRTDLADSAVLIDISHVRELQRQSSNRDGLEVGGGVTLTQLLELLDREIAAAGPIAARKGGLEELRRHIAKMATHQLRNVATLAGNLMLARQHARERKAFISDLLTAFAALDATATFVQPDGTDIKVPVLDLLTDRRRLHSRAILRSVRIPFLKDNERFLTWRVARVPQNGHPLVNEGFRYMLAPGGRVAAAKLVFGGVARATCEMTDTVEALRRGPVSRQSLDKVQETFAKEVAAHAKKAPVGVEESGITSEYRQSLAQALFYKSLLTLAKDLKLPGIKKRLDSAIAASDRLLCDGTQGCMQLPSRAGQPPPAAPPVIPATKQGAIDQTTGEAKYTHDLWEPRTLSTAYVTSKQAFARFDHKITGPPLLDKLRKKFPGVVAYVTSADLANPLQYVGDPALYDPVFANEYVTCAGQPIGLVVAESKRIARQAAAYVGTDVIEYFFTDANGNPLTPVLTVAQAQAIQSTVKPLSRKPDVDPATGKIIRLKSLSNLYRPPTPSGWQPGSADAGLRGTQATGAQAHFYMETQSALAVPSCDEMTLYCSSQDLHNCQGAVAKALDNPPIANKVRVRATRIGGGFGGKELRPPYFAAAAAVAANKTGLPVRIALDRHADMAMVGKRHHFVGQHFIWADATNKIDQLWLGFDSNAGCSYDCSTAVMDLALLSADACYDIPQFAVNGSSWRTNLPSNTAMRSFGLIQTILAVENAIEHLAHERRKLPEDIRQKNFYKERSKSHFGQSLTPCRIREVWRLFRKSTDFDVRLKAVKQFNRDNRWRKRGISMIPLKYGISYTSLKLNQGSAYVMAYSDDGSVRVHHGGVEMGQGIHTKIAQIAADTLDIGLSQVRVVGTDTNDVANASSTGASTGTDLNGGAVRKACMLLRKNLRDFCRASQALPDFPKDQNGNAINWDSPNWGGGWPQIVKFAYAQRQNLAAEAQFKSPHLAELDPTSLLMQRGKAMFYYYTYSAAVSEVEIDVLTGEAEILRTDIVYDSGQSVNPNIEYGQIEGGFVQGIGNVMTEQLYDDGQGRLLSDGTLSYKIPCSKSVPRELNVKLLSYGRRGRIHPHHVQSGKSAGEPPFVLAASVFFATKHAVAAARADAGDTSWFELDAPATVERIQQACLTDPANQLRF